MVPLAAIGATIFEAALDILPATGLVDRLTVGRLLIILALVALLATGARLPDFRTGADIAIGLLILAAAFTTVRGGWDGAPLRFLITAVAAYYVVVATIRRFPNARSAISLMALTGVVATAGLGIAQVAEEDFTGFYRDGLEPITSEIVRPDLQVRAIGSFINPNLLASFVVLLGPIGLATAAWVPRREMRWTVFGLTALAYIGLVLTFSRSAVLGAILGALLVILLLPAASPIRKAAIWTAAGLAVAAIVAAVATAGRAVGAFGRFEAWELALEAAANEPATGVGLGRSGDVIVEIGGTDETFAHAHNLWLNWLVEAGPVAFLAIAFLTIWLVVEAARGTLRGDAFMAAALAGMVGFLVVSFTDHPANTERVAITFWILAGVIAASGAPSLLAPWLGGPDDSDTERPPPVLASGPAPEAAAAAATVAAAPLLAPEPAPLAEKAEDPRDAGENDVSDPLLQPEEPPGTPPGDGDVVRGSTAPIPLIVPIEEGADDETDGADEDAQPAVAPTPPDDEPTEPPEPAALQADADSEAVDEGPEAPEPVPPILAGVDDAAPPEPESADTGEIPRPPELAPDADTEPTPPETLAEAEAPDPGPADEDLAPEPIPEDPNLPPALFFDQDAERDAREIGPLGTPAPGEPEPSEPVAFFDHAAEPAPPTPDGIEPDHEEGDAPAEPVAQAGDDAAPEPAPAGGADPDDPPEIAAGEPEAPEPERGAGVDAWVTFESLADELRDDPAVTGSTMMAAPSLRRDGKYFAALWHDSRLAVKLPRSRSRSMIDDGVAEEFAPAGRTLDEWVLVTPKDKDEWRGLLEEAKGHAAGS